MIACTDTYYTDIDSRTAVVQFDDWRDKVPESEYTFIRRQSAADYVPGQFYRRELPCIISAVKRIRDKLSSIVIDGYVWLDGHGRKGLGAVLYEELGQSVTVIGVAKNKFSGSSGVEVFRGKSSRPLIVTAAGMEVERAASFIEAMAGENRIPGLLKRADHRSRHGR
jgi:deoxyribonuclease V